MSERPDKTPWQRHWMIRRRANWLRDMMASDLGGPAKVAGYALATFLDERSMTAHQVAQKAIAGAAGMSERQLRDALGYLICEGWIECKDEGRHANSYRAIERGDLMGPECCEAEKGRLVRRKTAGIKTDVVRRKNVSCEAEKGPLSGGKPPHLYSIVTVDSRAFEESPDTLPNDTPSPEAAPPDPHGAAPSGARPTPEPLKPKPPRTRVTRDYRAILAKLDTDGSFH